MSVSKACKVFHRPTGRYWPAVTWDVSSGGVLLGIDAPRPLERGDTVEVFVSWGDKALLSKEDRMIAEVKRVLPRTDGKQLVGVEFALVIGSRRAAA